MQLCSFYLPDQARKSFGIALENCVVDVGLRLGADSPNLKTFLQRSSMANLATFRDFPADYALFCITVSAGDLKPRQSLLRRHELRR